jgi:FkbM family methyltransferase
MGVAMNIHTLPNGLQVKHRNIREIQHLYQDIFEKRVYFQHGIKLREHSMVIDAGANVGLFSLFVLANCPTATIHAFEPAPKTFEILRANTSSHPAVQVNNCGLGSRIAEEFFVYLPTATAGSGYYDYRAIPKMKERLRSAILNDPERAKPYQGPVGEEFLDYVLDERFKAEVVTTKVCTLSSYIDEKKIQHIDLLKIDVEGKECDVLAGIRNDQWAFIDQLVVEAHEIHAGVSSAPQVLNMLTERGYSVQIMPENGMLTTMVYARR